MDIDRELLFGVVALQVDLIDRAQFVDACSRWATCKDVPLSELLIKWNWILPTDKVHVDYLLERKLQRKGGDAAASIASLPAEVRLTISTLTDSELSKSVDIRSSDNDSTYKTVDYIPDTAGRYQLIRLHARGGLSSVWMAKDSILDRCVALKELHPEKANDSVAHTRFLNEAKITGLLEHPGVIPVYELSHWANGGLPFYAMRFMNGQTLTDAAHAYHHKRREGRANSADLLMLLNAFVAVCQTVAYAHKRGVLHRDLKGQNVLLGDFGEVIVLDWGLAKWTDGRESELDTERVQLDLLESTAGDLTMEGQVLGTPAYMAPEQAAGQLELIGEHTDVYGLGAILYEILTGRPPFVGPNVLQIVSAVQNENPEFPHSIWPDVPSTIESVCMRALSKKPADRYSSPIQLAHEVQQWQEVERRRAEEALRKSEEKYRTLVETTTTGFLIVDAEGRVIDANAEYVRLSGHHTLEQILGRSVVEWTAPYHRERNAEEVMRCIRQGYVRHLEIDYIDHEKHITPVEIDATVMQTDEGLRILSLCRDITDRKQAEKALRQSYNILHAVSEGTTDAVFVKDIEGRYLMINTAGASFLSKSVEEVIGKDDTMLFSHGTATAIMLADQEIMKAGEIKTYEDIGTVDGVTRTYLSTKGPYRDEHGNTIGLIGISRDISERKRTEEALKQSEDRYLSVMAAMEDGIVLMDTDGCIRTCNASAKRIFGLESDQLIGRKPADFRWGAIREDSSPFPDEDLPATVTLRTGNPCLNVIMGVCRPDGNMTWLNVNSQPLFHSDGVTLAGAVASYSDITERKHLQEQLRQSTLKLAD